MQEPVCISTWNCYIRKPDTQSSCNQGTSSRLLLWFFLQTGRMESDMGCRPLGRRALSAEEEAKAGRFFLGFLWSPRPSVRWQSLTWVCALCQRYVHLHSGKGPCLNGGFGVGWPTIRSSSMPHMGRCPMGQTLLG